LEVVDVAVSSGVNRNLPFPAHTTCGITTIWVVSPPVTCALGSACRWLLGTIRLTAPPLAVADATSILTIFIVPSCTLVEPSCVTLVSVSTSSVLGDFVNGIHSPVRFNAPVLWTVTEVMFTTRLVRVTLWPWLP